MAINKEHAARMLAHLAKTGGPSPGARVVVQYSGVQIIDTRERLRIQFEAQPLNGVPYYLRLYGFSSIGGGGYEAANNPTSVMRAQEILSTWYGEQLP